MSGRRRDFFVTGTDTGVGKTLVAVALLRALRQRGLAVAGMKPVASGSARTPGGLRNEDALALQAECSRPRPYAVVNPYAFEPPIAPHLAAQDIGAGIRLEAIEQAFRTLQSDSDVVVVEGAGGFAVPLGPGSSFAQIPAALGLEVILVVGLRLGCLNHALLTAEAIAARRIPFAGWVGNVIDPGFDRLEANLGSLRQRLEAPCIGVIRHHEPPEIDAATGMLGGLADLVAMRDR